MSTNHCLSNMYWWNNFLNQSNTIRVKLQIHRVFSRVLTFDISSDNLSRLKLILKMSVIGDILQPDKKLLLGNNLVEFDNKNKTRSEWVNEWKKIVGEIEPTYIPVLFGELYLLMQLFISWDYYECQRWQNQLETIKSNSKALETSRNTPSLSCLYCLLIFWKEPSFRNNKDGFGITRTTHREWTSQGIVFIEQPISVSTNHCCSNMYWWKNFLNRSDTIRVKLQIRRVFSRVLTFDISSYNLSRLDLILKMSVIGDIMQPDKKLLLGNN